MSRILKYHVLSCFSQIHNLGFYTFSISGAGCVWEPDDRGRVRGLHRDSAQGGGGGQGGGDHQSRVQGVSN